MAAPDSRWSCDGKKSVTQAKLRLKKPTNEFVSSVLR